MNTVPIPEVVLGEENSWELNTNATDATADLCDEDVPCSQAARSDQAEYTRFDSADDASDYAESIGSDAYRSNFIVIDYRVGETSEEERAEIEQWIDGMHSSS